MVSAAQRTVFGSGARRALPGPGSGHQGLLPPARSTGACGVDLCPRAGAPALAQRRQGFGWGPPAAANAASVSAGAPLCAAHRPRAIRCPNNRDSPGTGPFGASIEHAALPSIRREGCSFVEGRDLSVAVSPAWIVWEGGHGVSQRGAGSRGLPNEAPDRTRAIHRRQHRLHKPWTKLFMSPHRIRANPC